MTLLQFIELDDASQQRALDKGVCVSDRKEKEFDVYLFQLESFYVEVFYHQKLHEIMRYRAFDNMNELKPYLTKIKLKFRKRKKFGRLPD